MLIPKYMYYQLSYGKTTIKYLKGTQCIHLHKDNHSIALQEQKKLFFTAKPNHLNEH